MKKFYQTPETHFFCIQPAAVIASSPVSLRFGSNYNGHDELESRGRRGTTGQGDDTDVFDDLW